MDRTDPGCRLVTDADQIKRSIADRRVRAELARQRITDDVIAHAMHQNQQWFNRRKNGAVAFSGAELALIADYLGVDVSQFFGGSRPGPGPDGGHLLPHLDSNQKPFGLQLALVA